MVLMLGLEYLDGNALVSASAVNPLVRVTCVISPALVISLVLVIPIPLVSSEFVVISPSPELPAPAVTVGVQFLSNTMFCGKLVEFFGSLKREVILLT